MVQKPWPIIVLQDLSEKEGSSEFYEKSGTPILALIFFRQTYNSYSNFQRFVNSPSAIWKHILKWWLEKSLTRNNFSQIGLDIMDQKYDFLAKYFFLKNRLFSLLSIKFHLKTN
jgi:hypothetical protein